MTEFQQDLFMIILDKVLIGLIAVAFGYYLSRLLERYRTRKSYELFVWQQRVDACQKAAKLITEHHNLTIGLHDMLQRIATKYPEQISDEEAKPGYDFIEKYEIFKKEMQSLTILLPAEVALAMMAYMNETGKVTDVIKGKFDQGIPTQEEITYALAKFHKTCMDVIVAGPYGKIKPIE